MAKFDPDSYSAGGSRAPSGDIVLSGQRSLSDQVEVFAPGEAPTGFDPTKVVEAVDEGRPTISGLGKVTGLLKNLVGGDAVPTDESPKPEAVTDDSNLAPDLSNDVEPADARQYPTPALFDAGGDPDLYGDDDHEFMLTDDTDFDDGYGQATGVEEAEEPAGDAGTTVATNQGGSGSPSLLVVESIGHRRDPESFSVGLDGRGLGIKPALDLSDDIEHTESVSGSELEPEPGDAVAGEPLVMTLPVTDSAGDLNVLPQTGSRPIGLLRQTVEILGEKRRKSAEAEAAAAAEAARRLADKAVAHREQVELFKATEAKELDRILETGLKDRFYAGDVEQHRLLGLSVISNLHYLTRARVAVVLEESSGIEWDQTSDPDLLATEREQTAAIMSRNMKFARDERGVDMDSELDAERRGFVINRVDSAVDHRLKEALVESLPAIYHGIDRYFKEPTQEEIRQAKKRGEEPPRKLSPAEAMVRHREDAFIRFAERIGLKAEGPDREFDIAEGSRTITVLDRLVADDEGQVTTDPNVMGITKIRRAVDLRNNSPSGSNMIVEGIWKSPKEDTGFVIVGTLSGVRIDEMLPEPPRFPGRSEGRTDTADIEKSIHNLPGTATEIKLEVRELQPGTYAWISDLTRQRQNEERNRVDRAQLQTVHPDNVGRLWAQGLYKTVIPTLDQVADKVARADEASRETFKTTLDEGLKAIGGASALVFHQPEILERPVAALGSSADSFELTEGRSDIIDVDAVTTMSDRLPGDASLADLVSDTMARDNQNNRQE